MSINKVFLQGRLGKDPEVKTVGENQVAQFSLATSSYSKKGDEKIETTDWHNIVIWGKLAKVAGDYLKKGQECTVIGSIRNRTYDDKDGNKKYITEILVNELSLGAKASGSSEASEPEQPQQQNASQVVSTPADDTDLPF